MLPKDIYISLSTKCSSIHAPSVIVISPHPDDDVIGMGGKMALMAKSHKVITLYMTDGCGSLRKDAKDQISSKRKQEALSALSIVGADGAFFLEARSSWLKQKGEEYQRLLLVIQEILQSIQPKEIYMTAPWEIHPTHLASSQIVLDALPQKEKISLYAYPVWGPILGKKLCYVDITEVIETKQKAIQAHYGEVSYKPYHEGVLARNFYQAVFEDPHSVSKAKYREVFLDMSDIKTDLKQYAVKEAKEYVDTIFTTLS